MNRALLLLFLMILPMAVPADAAVRPNGLIFNETVTLTPGQTTELPIYFTRRGEYYAEAILEREAGSERPDAVGLGVTVSIARRDETLLFERALTTELGRERPAATLFWLTTDREVPLKTPLTLAIRIDDADATSEVLRLQVRRKLNQPLRFR